MRFFLNILWLIFGGLLTNIGYVIASLFLMITIFGISFGFQILKLAGLTFFIEKSFRLFSFINFL